MTMVKKRKPGASGSRSGAGKKTAAAGTGRTVRKKPATDAGALAARKYNEAYNRAYDAGYDQGFNDGYAKGLEDGALDAQT